MSDIVKPTSTGNHAGMLGAYYLQINIGNKIWTLDPTTLLRFLWEEEAGNVGAVMEMDFVTKDTSILAYLNEGNEIKVTIGGLPDLPLERKQNKSKSYDKHVLPVTIVRMEIKYDQFPYVQVYCSGLIGNYDYFINTWKQVIKQKNSIDAIKDLLATNGKFPVIDNTVTVVPKDTQNWIQYNITDRDFLSDIWLHSDLGDTVLLTGINSQGHFIMRDTKSLLKKLAAKKYKYMFTNSTTPQDALSKGIISYSKILYNQASSIMNNSYTYGREKLVYDLENGTESLQNQSITSSGLSLSGKLNRKDSVTKLATQSGMINGNVHSTYHKVYNHNVGYMLAISSSNLVIGFEGKFIKDLQILDPINITVASIDPQDKKASKFETGGYIISKVTRCLMNSQITTTITACRDNINEIKGKLR